MLSHFFYSTTAASEHGLKIMAMLYLTPILPLGLVSYMCGTTAMDLSSFALAKIASLPLYLIYTFIGASAHSFIKSGSAGTSNETNKDSNVGGGVQALSGESPKIDENQYLIVSGLLLSLVMMTLITRNIRKELMKVRDFSVVWCKNEDELCNIVVLVLMSLSLSLHVDAKCVN
jgi:hypothetical protein